MQKYLHSLKAWDATPVEAQEKIVGRAPGNYDRLLDFSKAAIGSLF